MPAPTLEGWAEIRFAYEHTKRTVESICAEHGISSGTLRDRMKRWNWRRRQLPVSKEGPAAMARDDLHPPLEGEGRRATSEARCEPGWGDGEAQRPHPTPLQLADASRSDPPLPGEGEVQDTSPAATVARLQRAVSRVLSAIEATTARLTAGRQSPRQMEQAGRTLGTLTRTLRDLSALLSQQKTDAGAVDDDPVPENIDEFREALAQRIENIIASLPGRAEEAKSEET